MIVKGVNDNQLDIDTYDIFSNASCTTNCIGPVAKSSMINLNHKWSDDNCSCNNK